MKLDNPEARTYLYELYTMTQGDTDAQASMYDVGSVLGLEEADAGTMAEELFIQGFAELKTLSGGIGITRQGLEALDIKVALKPGEETLSLGTDRILETPGQEAVEQMVQDIKADIAQKAPDYAKLEEMVMDIKTIEIQMLSPNPKTNIIREVFKSLHSNLSESGLEDLALKLDALITS